MSPDSQVVMSDTISRLRLLERRQDTIREKLLIINQNMIGEYKKLLVEIQSLNKDIQTIKTGLQSLQDSVKNIIRDTDTFARKDHVKVLEKYINLWNPLNFVTESEVINLIKRSKHGSRKKVSKRKHR